MSKYFRTFKDREAIETVKGIKIWSVYLNNTMTTYMEFEPNSIIPEHKHEHEQITVILEGKMNMVVENEGKIVEKGDVIAIPSNVPHSAQVLDTFTIAIDAWSPIREDYK